MNRSMTVRIGLACLLSLCSWLTLGYAADPPSANAEEPGLAALTGKSTPFKQGTTVAFFGDSITMQGGYIETMRRALAASPQTKDLNVKLLQHGLNGGRVPTVLEGESPWASSAAQCSSCSTRRSPMSS